MLDHGAPGYLDEIAKVTGGQGVNVVLEMLANVNLQKDLGIIAMGGRIAVIGNRGNTEINARVGHQRERGDPRRGAVQHHARPSSPVCTEPSWKGSRNGTLRPVIAMELPLGQASRAHEAVLEPGHHGKIALVP